MLVRVIQRESFTGPEDKRLKDFKQRLREDLRKRFRTEYFGFLRQETRRRSKTRPIKVGDLVLIGQDNAKRVNWPLARVVEVYPGRDGPVRVAKLRTSKGVQIRPVQRLYNLEIPADLGSTLRSIQSEPRRGDSRGEARRHYGAISCEGCKGFFKRSIRKQLGYTCRGSRDCEVNKHHRNRCQYCRLQKCLAMGMRTDSVQSERKPVESKEKVSPFTPAQRGMFKRKSAEEETTVAPVEKESPKSQNSHDHSSDLTTLAHVVTSLAVKNEPSEEEWQKDKDISKAFDTIAKVAGADATFSLQTESEDSESLFEIEGPLLMEFHANFHLRIPSPGSGTSYLNVHYICESASRLLFLSVHWARSIHAFQLLRSEVQMALVKGSWSDLFTLGLAQCSQALSLATILSAIGSHLNASVQQDKLSATRVKEVTDHIGKLQAFVNSLLRLQVDDHEFAYLRALALFSQDHQPGARQVEKFQEKAYQELRAYIQQSFPANNDRFPKLLLRLMSLRSLSAAITEELFFAGLIGNVQIDSIIPYILKMEANEPPSCSARTPVTTAATSNPPAPFSPS
ncbi:NR2C1 [Cordylochernes scorpioides]|uniref:NR2C1 n=1 Tax=Cordylochernes scorpioides TaxID=51811 RepID=A0ABY6KIJ0_9ARAC|nr:NR2C1 [Cordylochernes scorpioides]